MNSYTIEKSCWLSIEGSATKGSRPIFNLKSLRYKGGYMDNQKTIYFHFSKTESALCCKDKTFSFSKDFH